VRDLFLHEVVDIVGAGAWPYMEHTVRAAADERPGFELLGTWYTMGITGRWPQVINIWEVIGGWDGWQRCVEGLGLARRGNDALAGWWKKALTYRSGGFDRLLGAVPGCPGRADLVARGVRGSVFVHEVASVRPGAALDYLAALREEWLPVASEYGLEPVGLWEVLGTDTEVCTVFATEPAGPVRLAVAYDAARGLGDEADGDARLVTWAARAREFCTGRREELMTPCPGTLCAPTETGDSGR
jgi:hypothetical protein